MAGVKIVKKCLLIMEAVVSLALVYWIALLLCSDGYHTKWGGFHEQALKECLRL